MEKIVGNVVSENSNISYPIKWDSDKQISLIYRGELWMMIGKKVQSEEAALLGAQEFINSQTNIY